MIKLLSLITFLFAFDLNAEKKPELFSDSKVFNYGQVGEGDLVEHEFIIKNIGNDKLEIVKVVPACGCTDSKVEDKIILPNNETKLKVKFDTSGFTGDKVKTIRVYTNDPDNYSYVFTLKGTILPMVEVKPNRIFFEDIIPGSDSNSYEKTLKVSVRDGSPAVIDRVYSYSKNIQITELKSSNRYKEVKVKLVDLDKIGDYRERLIIDLSKAKRRSINVPIFANVISPVRVTPSAISFGLINKEESEITRNVKIINSLNTPIKIEKIINENDFLKVNLKEIKKGKIFGLEILLDPNKIKSDFRSTVKLITDHPDYKNISLNVYGSIENS